MTRIHMNCRRSLIIALVFIILPPLVLCEGGNVTENNDDEELMGVINEIAQDRESRQGRLEMAQRVLSNRRVSRRRRGLNKTRKYGNRERNLESMEQWKTMKLVVEADTQAFRRQLLLLRRIPQSTALGAAAFSFAQGDILVGGRCQNADGELCGNFDNNNMFRRNNPNVPVGVSFQTCITPTLVSKSINTWLCTWVLSFSDMVMNQVMAQGNYYRAATEAQFAWAPQYQFLAITGGTGIFRGVTGFIIISPRDLGMRPGILPGSAEAANLRPEFWYYLVYRLF